MVAILGIGIPVLIAIVAIALLAIWLLRERAPVDVQPRQPAAPAAGGQPGEPGQPPPIVQPTEPAAPSAAGAPPAQPEPPAQSGSSAAAQGSGTPGAASGSWPQFRGPNRDNISPEKIGLARSWPSSGPRKLWSIKLGRGHAGAAVLGGRVYVLDYNESRKGDLLRCLSLDTGKEIWSQFYPVEIKYNHGISRTVPAVTNKYVVTIGPKCMVMCCDSQSGEVLWKKDLVQLYGAQVPSWYTGQCPLIDGNKVIIAPGGKSIMIAVDLASGSVAWEAPNPDGWQMTYASIMPMTLGGTKTYVYPSTGGIVGVSSAGKVLWKFPGWKVSTAECPSALYVGNNQFFISGGYNAGSLMLRGSGGGVSKVFALPQSVFGSHNHTPILHGNHIYGVSIGDKQLVCLDLKGKRVWSSGHTATFGLGPYLLAEGMLYVLSEDGTLVLAEASTSGYKELARAKVVGVNAWGPMALVGGRLICRDEDTMICLDVKNP
ncbi:MAG TPA: PQQ-binding-like beta-propeller repeat protein [Armatimonadota bacterium]|nr:PQQ-binding-like beta-propeller repeat protein [Armatimonadota bacterium]